MLTNLDVIKLILKEDPAYEHQSRSKYNDLTSVISTASREGYKDIVKILYENTKLKTLITHFCVILIEDIVLGEKGTQYFFKFLYKEFESIDHYC